MLVWGPRPFVFLWQRGGRRQTIKMHGSCQLRVKSTDYYLLSLNVRNDQQPFGWSLLCMVPNSVGSAFYIWLLFFTGKVH